MRNPMLIMSILLFLLASPFLISNYNKKRLSDWDQYVAELCKSEGGIAVYETIDVSPESNPELVFASDGVILRSERFAEMDPYFFSAELERLRDSNPTILKSSYSIVRSSDLFVMGESTGFIRRGGDFPPFFLGTATSFSCNELNTFELDLKNAVFKVLGG